MAFQSWSDVVTGEKQRRAIGKELLTPEQLAALRYGEIEAGNVQQSRNRALAISEGQLKVSQESLAQAAGKEAFMESEAAKSRTQQAISGAANLALTAYGINKIYGGKTPAVTAPTEGVTSQAETTAPYGTAENPFTAETPVAQNIGETAVTEGAPETGAGFSWSSTAGPVAAIGALEMYKQKGGGGDVGWDEKTDRQKVATAPGTAPLLPVSKMFDKVFGENNIISKSIKELGRIEQQALKPIDWVFGGGK